MSISERLLTEKNISRLDACVKLLNEKLRQLSAIKEVVDGKASVSSGYAVYDAEIDQSLSDTLKRSDMVMYENKMLHKKWTETYSKIRPS